MHTMKPFPLPANPVAVLTSLNREIYFLMKNCRYEIHRGKEVKAWRIFGTHENAVYRNLKLMIDDLTERLSDSE